MCSSSLLVETLTLVRSPFRGPLPSRSPLYSSPPHRRIRLKSLLSTCSSSAGGGAWIAGAGGSSLTSKVEAFPVAGVEEALMGFITGKRKATEVAHSLWQNVVRKGDTVIDATCGNGHDTLALLKMIADESGKGCVYGMDIQNTAVENTSLLLDKSVDKNERKLVKLFQYCHSKMENIAPKDNPVRLVAFNLGYLPGGDKTIVTRSETTLMGLEAASKILGSAGLISVMVYVGHPGGRDELETVQSFASNLPAETWASCKFEMLNRPTGPVLLLLFKK